VRFLLVNNHCISDPTAGVTHSMRTLIGWLADERLVWRDGKGWLDGHALDAPVVEDFETVKGH